LGERYEILEMLGRGGMGEVWRAFDLKLRVEVALKALREDLFQSEGRREMLRQEVRAAREVISPNVCRIFDLIEIDSRELVSMEYVDGATLLGVLQERGPLELKEAQDIASQFLSGLEAIHKAGLVHRDVKPENIMLTRAGRVVVMDFGLARGPESGAGSVSGTPAYMAPEHAAGQEVDARADVYSAGVVLAEMVSPEGIKSYKSRQSVWEGVRSEPAKVPDSPWASVIKRAVARDRERRQNSAHTLIRELENVTLRVEGAEDLHPYPGLASFTESDAEYFFGREAEIERLWRKLDRPHLLGVVGPSGAGKTSFLRAGLIPSAGPGWAILRCTPGSSPFTSLGQALAREMAGDVEAMELLARGHEPNALLGVISRWRRRFNNALLIVDQFEELFTHTSAEEQQRFADLMGRLALEADTFVLLSMRDDFLLRCREHEALAPVFTELTALLPPTGGALRRSVVQPATKCGYRFEDDVLVEEILAEVEGERGALPLLAFALARLWEKRDRETGLLTRQAYHDIGGVGGALARHAEATVDKIGVERIPIVRELFRNLVTAEGTRAVREWGELLSIFNGGGEGINPSPTRKMDGVSGTPVGAGFTPAREAAEEVLRELIDARLLTSYEVRDDEHEPTRRVEIIHESLLANWPRLVRWQTQDADAVQVREQLRQAAKTWDEHDRTDDMLWTGSAYRQFSVWRENYPGGLTDVEEDFTNAMSSLANKRRRRRRVIAASLVVFLVVAATVLGALWRRSVSDQRRAEAAGLLSQAQLELESYPSAAIAFATASLEHADTDEARHLALTALWRGPTAFVVNELRSWEIGFTPDGRWLVQAMDEPPYQLRVIGADGSVERLEDIHDNWVDLVMDTTSGFFATYPWGNDEPWALWSAPEKRLLTMRETTGPVIRWGSAFDSNRRRVVLLIQDDERLVVDALEFEGEYRRLGVLPFTTRRNENGNFTTFAVLQHTGDWLAVLTDDEVHRVLIDDDGLGPPERLTHIAGRIKDYGISLDPLERFIALRHEDGAIRLWDLDGHSPPKVINEPPGISWIEFSHDGTMLKAGKSKNNERSIWVWSLDGDQPTLLRRNNLGVEGGIAGETLNPIGRQIVSVINPDSKIRMWPLSAPADAAPVIMQRGDLGKARRVEIHPNGKWLASSFTDGLTLWPLTRSYPIVIDRYEDWKVEIAFGPRGEWLATSSVDSAGTVRLWQLDGSNLPAGRVVAEVGIYAYSLAASPDGKNLIAGSHAQGAHLISLDGQPPGRLPGDVRMAKSTVFSRDGRFAAATTLGAERSSGFVHVWDLVTDETYWVVEVGQSSDYPGWLQFVGSGQLLLGGQNGLERWDLESQERGTLFDDVVGKMAVSSDGSKVVFVDAGNEPTTTTLSVLGKVAVLDLATEKLTVLETHGDRVVAVAFDSTGEIVVSADVDGAIRVSPISGEQPHLLLGSVGEVFDVAVDPMDRWIASTSGTELRLWPMPDLSKPPLHTLPREELIAKLKTLTNLRVVRDPDSATGWTLTHDPFPGWETVPSW
jgi:WD40 repeat protein